MTLDYASETLPPEFVLPPSLLSCVKLRSGEVKLFNFRVNLRDLRQNAHAIPQHRPKQHVVCLHHFDRSMKFERNLDGRTRRETTAKGDIAFLPADAPTMLRPARGKDDPSRLLSYSYLVFEPGYWHSSRYRMESAARSTLSQHLRHQTLSSTKLLPLLSLRRGLRIRQRTSSLKPCSTRRVREFCAIMRKFDTRFPVHHDSPTINCVWRSILSMTISENRSNCARFLELPA